MTTMIISSKGQDLSSKSIMKDFLNMIDSEAEDHFDSRKEVSLLVKYMSINDCDNCLFFEHTKRNFRIWLATPSHTIRLSVLNYASVFDLSTPFNYHKNSGHVILFTSDFEEDEKLKIFKKTAEAVFACKADAPIERAISFFFHDGKICLRSYLINGCSELGPRIDMCIERVFEGCFQGKKLYSNAENKEMNKQE